FFSERLWQLSLNDYPPLQARGITLLRFVYAINRELSRGGLSLHAMGLVYTTLLSLAPLLAVSFSVLKAFGVHNQIEPLLLNFLAPLGDKGVDISRNIITFVENMNVALLGSVGVVMLLYTVMSLIHKIEISFNIIWHYPMPRSFFRRFTDYLSVILIGPVLIFSGLGLTATMTNHTLTQKVLAIEPFGSAFVAAGQVAPYLLITAAFTFTYLFIPNTRVKFSAALVGGVMAGVVWKTAGWAFALFVTHSTNYDAIYSSLAILIIFMIWLYVSWLILLVGAQLSFYTQNPHYLRVKKSRPSLSPLARQRLGLLTMQRIAKNFYHGNTAPSLDELSTQLTVPRDAIEEIIAAYLHHNLLTTTATEPPRFLPRQELSQTPLTRLLQALQQGRNGDEIDTLSRSDATLQRINAEIEQACSSAGGVYSLLDLIGERDSSEPPSKKDKATDRRE
ncbi:MAG: rbnC, partial [Halothiobacillaceae bacterium]